jgi:hypothetical protein
MLKTVATAATQTQDQTPPGVFSSPMQNTLEAVTWWPAIIFVSDEFVLVRVRARWLAQAKTRLFLLFAPRLFLSVSLFSLSPSPLNPPKAQHSTAASGGPLLFDQHAPFAILKPKNRKTAGT